MSITTDCDCESIVHWTWSCAAGVCPACASVYVAVDSEGRRLIEVYAVGNYLESCRLSERFHFGGEA